MYQTALIHIGTKKRNGAGPKRTPANSEERGSCQQAPIDLRGWDSGQLELVPQKRLLLHVEDIVEGKHIQHYAPAHHEGERGVPVTEQVDDL